MEYLSSKSHSSNRWYAVSTRSRQEKVAAATLQALGIDHILALQAQRRQWSDRVQTIDVPLFPGYLFVHIDPWSNSRLDVLRVPGIARFVGDHTGPLPIDNSDIEDIRALANCGVELTPHPFLKKGDRVRVVRGALFGIEGILIRIGSGLRVVLSIEVIHQSVVMTVSQNDVELISSGPEKIRQIA